MSVIDDKHAQLLQNGILNLGLPLGPEVALDDGGSKRAYQFGAIYYHPRIGDAFECHGQILAKYVSLGEQASGFGYPISDEQDNPSVLLGRMNEFEAGSLNYDVGNVSEHYADTPAVSEIIVKIADGFAIGLDLNETLDLDALAAAVGIAAGNPLVQGIRGLFPDIVFARLFSGVSSQDTAELIAAAHLEEPAYQPPKFDNYLVVTCPDGLNVQLLCNNLLQLAGIVELAYVMPVASDPGVVATANPLFVGQGFLGAAPQGVGVQAAWAKGADGAGVRFVDLEQGWLFSHEDLPKPIPLLGGVNRHESFSHGAAVLGETSAIDDNRGIVGVAPSAMPRVISYFSPGQIHGEPHMRQRVASRILESAKSLRFGDVLQLEVQLAGEINSGATLVPIETDPAVFEAIRLVAHIGIIVTEAAGNGGGNLDSFTDSSGRHVLDPTKPAEFKDSRAIMVGACTSAVPHGRWVASNFGNRIDCWAWGEHVITTGNPGQPTLASAYWTNPYFQGTSAATPIISGLCMLIQNLQTLLTPKPGQVGKLGGQTMRTILRKPANGTAVAGSNRIMPDMARIITNEYLP